MGRPGATTETRGGELLRILEEAVAGELRLRGDRLRVRRMEHWVSFGSQKLRRVFAELRPHAANLELFLLPTANELGADGRASAAPPTQGWGWFRSKLRITSPGDIATTRAMVIRSYEARCRMNRRGRRADTRSRKAPTRKPHK